MSIDDQGDVWRELREMKRKIARLESGSMLENSSITRGRMRFIGGLLRVDSGGRVEIVGTLAVEGSSQFVGPVTISGQLNVTGPTTVTGEFTLDGPWTINGDGDITGDVDVTGDLEVLGGGRIKVGNVVLTPGNGGRITIGTGSSQIIIDPSQLKVGPAFKMDPAHSSSGAQQAFGLTGKSTIFGDDQSLQLQLGNVLAAVRLLSNVGPIGTGPGVSLEGMVHAPNIQTLPSGQAAFYLAIGTNGVLYRTSGTGGGGGSDPGPIAGDFMWPFSQSATDPVLGFYGMRINPVTGQYRLHAGQDFSVPYGSSIPAAGDGTISAVGYDSGRGNFVVIDHGNGITTHYFHMAALSQLQVGDTVQRGARIGAVGSTGNSTGAHLHWETHVNGTAIDPRVFMANQEG